VKSLILIAAAFGAAQAAAAPKAPVKPSCAPAPALDAGALGSHRQAADLVRRNFATAYRQACSTGILRGRRLIRPGSVPPGKLFLLNAPDSNIASIYNEGEERPGRMVLEYHFVTADRRVHVPGADELEEAIFCAVVGATSEEDEGRCLPD